MAHRLRYDRQVHPLSFPDCREGVPGYIAGDRYLDIRYPGDLFQVRIELPQTFLYAMPLLLFRLMRRAKDRQQIASIMFGESPEDPRDRVAYGNGEFIAGLSAEVHDPALLDLRTLQVRHIP